MSETSVAPTPPRRPFLPRALPYLLSLPALLVCIGILVPFVTAVVYSLQRYNLSMPYLRSFIGLGNYVSLFTDPDFWNTIKVSLTYTVSTVVLELLLGLGIALLLRERNRLNNIISIALLMPLMTAPAIAALMWKLMTNPGFGVLSWLISLVGITDFRWASSPHTAMFTVVLVDIWVYTPFMMILLLAGLRSLPQQPFEAARLDGVNAGFVFLFTAVLFRTLDSIQQFDIIYAMTQGGPGNSLLVFQVRAYLEFFSYTNVGRSAAILMILWAITYVLSQVFVRQWTKLRERSHGVA
jgi:multiple sugar transport system permease protein